MVRHPSADIKAIAAKYAPKPRQARESPPAKTGDETLDAVNERLRAARDAEAARPRPAAATPKPREHSAKVPTPAGLRALAAEATKKARQAAAAASEASVTAAAAGAPVAGPKRRALLIGLDYGHQAPVQPQQAPSSGARRWSTATGPGGDDVEAMRSICSALKYHEVRILAESERLGSHARDAAPTRDEILAGCDWLVAGAAAGDVLLFHYSGRGGLADGASSRGAAASSASAVEEMVVPSDYATAGGIPGAELLRRLVEPLRGKGASLRIVFDGQQTGAGLDLKHNLADASRLRDQHAIALAALNSHSVTACGDGGGAIPAPLVAMLKRKKFVADGPTRFIEWDSRGRNQERPFGGLQPRPPGSANNARPAEVLVLSSYLDVPPRAADSTLTRCFVDLIRRGLCRGAPWPAAIDVARDVRIRVHSAGAELTPQCSSETPIDDTVLFNLA